MKLLQKDLHATHVAYEDLKKLKPQHIRTLHELNMWEESNIQYAELKLFRGKKPLLFTPKFVQKVHHLMFHLTWNWAGKFRTTDTNIGVVWTKIPSELAYLCGDTVFQQQNASYPLEEIAVRFSHRLVSIHPFPNGNGRCSRLLVDLLLFRSGQERLTWGRKSLVEPSETRKHYIRALQEADRHDIRPLLLFAKS